MLDLNKLLQEKSGSNVTKNTTSKRVYAVRIKRTPKPAEPLRLPGNWRHVIVQALGDDDLFTDLNSKIQDAIMVAKKPRLIGLLNKSTPVSIDCNHVGIVVFLLRTEYGTTIRLFIKSHYTSLTIRLSVDGHNLLYIDYADMVAVLPEYELAEDNGELSNDNSQV